VLLRDEDDWVDVRPWLLLVERTVLLGVTVWLRDEEELFVPVVTRVRPVVEGVVVTEGERRLLVVPSVYLGVDELRPVLTEPDELEDVRPVLELLLKDEERPVDAEVRPDEETRLLLPLYEAELLPLAYERPDELREA
jgi:hypothetical protein